jgi:hypothetical protein
MRQVSLEKPDSEVDVCDACGGLWIDWFDGEVRLVATEALRQKDAAPRSDGGKPSEKPKEAEPSARSTPSGPPRNEAQAVGACPRCTRQLVAERYMLKAEIASRRVEGKTSVVPAPTGAELLRCEECMGSFVARPSAEVLSWLSATDEAPPSSAAVALQPVPWQRFVGVLKSFLGVK